MQNYNLKKLSFLLFICSLGYCTIISPHPRLTVNKNNIALGNIPFDSTISIQYVLYNLGNLDLVIDTVTASCDCTVPKLLKKIIVPHDSSNLLIQFKPVNIGEFNKAVIIKSNIDSSFTILKFSGFAIKK